MEYVIAYLLICFCGVVCCVWFQSKYRTYGNVKLPNNKRLKIQEKDRIELYKILCRIFSYRPFVFEPSSKNKIGFTVKNPSEFTIHYHSNYSGLLKNCSPVEHDFDVKYLKDVCVENVFEPIQKILSKYIKMAKTS